MSVSNGRQAVYKALISIIITLAVALSGVVYLYKRDLRDLSAANASLNDSVDRLTEASKRAQERSKRDAKALVAREREIASQARILAGQEQVLQNALQRDNDWSNTNVPPAVQEALAGASSPVPEPVPDGLRDQ